MKRKVIVGCLLLVALVVLVSAPNVFSQFQDSSGMIRLQAMSFDPLRQPSLAEGPAAVDKNNLYLVQFEGPVREAWKQAVEQTGARLYGYIPEHAFIARIDATTLEQVRALAFVRWVGPYQSVFKVAPGLARAQSARQRTGRTTDPDTAGCRAGRSGSATYCVGRDAARSGCQCHRWIRAGDAPSRACCRDFGALMAWSGSSTTTSPS